MSLSTSVVVPAPTGSYLSIAGLNAMIRSLIDNRRVPFHSSTGVYLVVTSPDISHDRFCTSLCGYHATFQYTHPVLSPKPVPLRWGFVGSVARWAPAGPGASMAAAA